MKVLNVVNTGILIKVKNSEFEAVIKCSMKAKVVVDSKKDNYTQAVLEMV